MLDTDCNMDLYGENLSVLPTEARSAIGLFMPYSLDYK